MWPDTSNTQSAMWQKNHDPPKFQYDQRRVAFTGYSNFSVRFWPAGQMSPDRFWPAGMTKQDWLTLQYMQQEQTQTSKREQQDTHAGPHADREVRVGVLAAQDVYDDIVQQFEQFLIRTTMAMASM